MWFMVVLGVVSGCLRWFVVVCGISTDRFNSAGATFTERQYYRNHYANMSVQYTAPYYMSVQYTAYFDGCKNVNFQFNYLLFIFIFIFAQNINLMWVHVRTASMRRF